MDEGSGGYRPCDENAADGDRIQRTRRYEVYLWCSAQVSQAEIAVRVDAVDADYAILLAMAQFSLTWVSAAEVVSVDDDGGEAVHYYSEDIWLLSLEQFQSFMRHSTDYGG